MSDNTEPLTLTITAGSYTHIYRTDDAQRVAAILSMLLNEDADTVTPEERAASQAKKTNEEIMAAIGDLNTRILTVRSQLNEMNKPQKETA
jgi:hypothetical protein